MTDTNKRNVRFAAITLTALAAVSVLPTPSYAAEYPWCAQYGSRGGGARNCGFVSYAQCMATVSGIGGFCEPNSFYKGPARKQRRDADSR